MISTTTMSCGHDSRYVYAADDLHGAGTQYCLMCVLDSERERNEKLAAEVERLQNRLEDFKIVVKRHTDGLLAAIIKEAAGQKEGME